MQEKELIIIGSGPAGLRAGEEAKKANIDYIILEQGEIAQSWKEIRQDMVMLSPCMPQRDWTSISNQFPIWKLEINRPFCYAWQFYNYLVEYAHHFDLCIKKNTRVTKVSKNGELFEIHSIDDVYRARTVLIATGIFGNPFIPDIPGMQKNPIVTHSHQFTSIEPFRGKRVVIIGSGNSAAETAILLAGYAQVYLLTREKLKFFSKTRNLCDIRGLSESLLNEFIDMEIIRHVPDTTISKVEDNILYFQNQIIETNAIICATGYNADLRALGSTTVQMNHRTQFPFIKDSGESLSIENLYFAGPLAYHKISDLLIHGFIKEVPGTIKKISEKLVLNTV